MQEVQNIEPYNSERPDLIIPEYGRNIHNMVNFALSVSDREERNKVAQAIISVMGQLFPYLRDIDDFKHKLWDHLHIMAKFQLDVDSPYPKPEAATFETKPDRIAYPQSDIRFNHYGKVIERMIEKAQAMEEGEERTAFCRAIADLMKRHYATYNHASVSDDLIIKQLKEMSKGELVLPENTELISLTQINRINSSGPSNNPTNKSRNFKKKKKKR